MQSLLSHPRRIMAIIGNEERLQTYSMIIKNPFNLLTSCLSYADALKRLPKDKPQLIVCDPYGNNQESADGFVFMRRAKDVNSSVKILVVTDVLDESSIIRCFKEGATGYILFSAGLQEFVKALESVFEEGSPMSKEVANVVVNSFKVSHNNPLTRREQDVLREVCTGKSYSYIADSLSISVDTVRTHVQHIFDKLNVQNKSEAVIKAREHKLI